MLNLVDRHRDHAELAAITKAESGEDVMQVMGFAQPLDDVVDIISDLASDNWRSQFRVLRAFASVHPRESLGYCRRINDLLPGGRDRRGWRATEPGGISGGHWLGKAAVRRQSD